MITGIVSEAGVPLVHLEVGGHARPAIIDTDFNGDLELPQQLRAAFHLEPIGQIISVLAAGQQIVEDAYRIEFEFDGEKRTAEVTFADGVEVLIGTRLLRSHRLDVDVPAKTVELRRA